ncbi:ATP-binding protein [Candidatus Bathyarchaeota archaeon]|nr:ATP-binding protein [Candidatus Bathyarchaeota archaeon]
MEISFADTGKGIPKEALEKLWTLLFTTKAQGMGFGLAICKRIVEAHGGSISVESTVGKGTTLTVSLPVNLKPEKDDKITIGLSELVSSKALR